MGKYLNFVRLSFGNLLEYRFNFVVQLISGLVGNVILLLFWTSLARAGVDIRPYTITSLVYYYFLMATITSIIGFSSDEVCWEIREGHVANDVIKPSSYLLKKWFSSLGEKVVTLMVGGMFVAILLILGFRLSSFSWASLMVFFPAVALAAVANFLIEFNVGLLGFWMMYTGGIRAMVGVVSLLVSGRMVPMELLPVFLNELSMVLPFRYIYFFPVQLLIGQLDAGTVLENFLVLTGWIVLLAGLTVAIWRVGVKQLEVIGT